MAWMTPFVDGMFDVRIVLSLTFTFPERMINVIFQFEIKFSDFTSRFLYCYRLIFRECVFDLVESHARCEECSRENVTLNELLR